MRAHRRASRAFEEAARALGERLGSDRDAREVLRRIARAADDALADLPVRRVG